VSRLLLVTADDFGLTEGVNRAVARAHREGIVTSTSLLAVGRAYSSAVALARGTPSLAVGVHLAAVGEDPPLLPPDEVPSLVDSEGRFPMAYQTFVRRAALGRVDMHDVRREFRAQVERVVGDGLTVTHLDTHQHLHLWPAVAEVVTGIARDFGIPAVRLPRSHRRSPLGAGVGILSRLLHRRLRAASLGHTDDYAGLDEAGALDQSFGAVLSGVLPRRDAQTVEITTHPGEATDRDLSRFAWGYRWAHELDLLVDPATRELVQRHDFRLGSWKDLVTLQ